MICFNLIDLGFLPVKIPADHLEYYDRRDYEIPEVEHLNLNWFDLVFLKDYGYWIEALYEGRIEAVNQVQREFVSSSPAGTGGRIAEIWREIMRLKAGLPPQPSGHVNPWRASPTWVGYREPRTILRRRRDI